MATINVGGISGYGGLISNSRNYGTVSAQRGLCGGICGAWAELIIGCFNKGDISGYEHNPNSSYTAAGGIAGDRSETHYCYNRGKVFAQKGEVGGIIRKLLSLK